MSDSNVLRLLYKEINEGDRKKFNAESNLDKSEGGGARDLRFSGFSELEGFLGAMFPGRLAIQRRRQGVLTAVDQFSANLHWLSDVGATQAKAAVIEPPTDARANEWRLTMVHTFGCFREAAIPAEVPGKLLILLMVQRDNGEIWPHFALEDDLRSGAWHSAVANPVVACIDAKRRSDRVVMGFYDYTVGKGYCNGG